MVEEIKSMKLNLACGQNKIDGFLGVDIVKTDITDKIMNLEVFPWDFKDDSVDEIFCSHYIEHTPDLIKFMDECYRILKVGGKMTVIAPYYTSVRATQDPTHKRFISESTFLYFNKEWMIQNKLEHYGIKADFDYTYGYSFSPMWAMRNEEARNFAIIHYNNVITDIQVILTKKEGPPKTSY
jgi:ubiquinone/menaquinone biosynthesis C-methylase UbiE